MTIALILWAVIGPSVGLVGGAAIASRHRDKERRPEAGEFGRSRDSALARAPAGGLDAASP